MPPEKDSKALSEERYSELAQEYVSSQSHAKGYDLDRLVEIALPQPDWEVLDVATGGGHTALKFAPFVKSVVATDLTENMLQAAEKHILAQGMNNVSFWKADAEALPFDDGNFDLVTCRIAAHHFPDVQNFIEESARVLKTGGIFVLQDHVLPENEEAARNVDSFEKLRDPSHNRAFSEIQWTQMVEKADLNVTHTEQITKRHDLLPWLERQGHEPGMIAVMVEMMNNFPENTRAWLQPQDWGTEIASFINHHILLAGKKGKGRHSA